MATRRRIQPVRWIKAFATQGNRQLAEQLKRLEESTYSAIEAGLRVVDTVTGKNLGTGARVFANKLSPYLRFRTLRGTGDVTVSENADGLHVDISATVNDEETPTFDLLWTTGAIGSTLFTISGGELLVSKTAIDVGSFWRTVYPRMARGGWVRAERLTVPADNLQVQVSRVREELDHLAFPIIAGDGSTTGSVSLLTESIAEFSIGEFASGSSETVEVTEEPSSTSLTNGATYRVQFIPQEQVYETALAYSEAYSSYLEGDIDIAPRLPPNGIAIVSVAAGWGVNDTTVDTLVDDSLGAVAYARLVMNDGELVSVWAQHYDSSGSSVLEQHITGTLYNPGSDVPMELQLLLSDGMLLVRAVPGFDGDSGYVTCHVLGFMPRRQVAA